MTEFGFYHLTRTPLEQAMPKLLEKMISTGKHTLVRLGLPERVESLDRALWTYQSDSWLPHGTTTDPRHEQQPILLQSASDDESCSNPNKAAYLILVDQAPAVDGMRFERVLEMFDGHDGHALNAARGRWKWAKEQGFDLVYWQQNEQGGWRKAR